MSGYKLIFVVINHAIYSQFYIIIIMIIITTTIIIIITVVLVWDL